MLFALFIQGALGNYRLFTSQVVDEELERALDKVKRYFLSILPQLQLIPMNNAALGLFVAYMPAQVVPVRYMLGGA